MGACKSKNEKFKKPHSTNEDTKENDKIEEEIDFGNFPSIINKVYPHGFIDMKDITSVDSILKLLSSNLIETNIDSEEFAQTLVSMIQIKGEDEWFKLFESLKVILEGLKRSEEKGIKNTGRIKEDNRLKNLKISNFENFIEQTKVMKKEKEDVISSVSRVLLKLILIYKSISIKSSEKDSLLSKLGLELEELMKREFVNVNSEIVENALTMLYNDTIQELIASEPFIIRGERYNPCDHMGFLVPSYNLTAKTLGAIN